MRLLYRLRMSLGESEVSIKGKELKENKTHTIKPGNRNVLNCVKWVGVVGGMKTKNREEVYSNSGLEFFYEPDRG